MTAEARLRLLSRMSEEDLQHAEDFLTAGHPILSGAFVRHAVERALRAAAAARGRELPARASMEALVRGAEVPPEIATACRELAGSPGREVERPDRAVDLGRRVVQWAARAVP
jgi:HEPN domain-containing protein